MKHRTTRLLGALLAVLLLVGTLPLAALATNDNHLLDQFEITVDQLPTAENTVADVLGSTVASEYTAAVTYNGGTEDPYYESSQWPLYIFNYNSGNNLSVYDSFTAGESYVFSFMTCLPNGLDIDNTLVSEDEAGNLKLDLPVYINGEPAEQVDILYYPDKDVQIFVNARYTVPVLETQPPAPPASDTPPAGASKELLKELHINGLALPEDGMTVYRSLTDCGSPELTVTSMAWYEVTEDGHLLPMINTDRFKAGTQYYFVIGLDASEVALDQRSSPAPSSWVAADVYLNGELVYRGDPLWGEGTHLDAYTHSENDYEITLEFSAHFVASPGLPFTDVTDGDYFFEAVRWAYNHEPQVTNGMSETTFGPDLTVTRGQCVTFLWRAMGCPEPAPNQNSFVDVSESDYYYKAVLWAVEKGITNGVDAAHFAPDLTLSTAHIATFLYRTLEIGTDGWYAEAADWAAQESLPDQTGLAIDPSVDCPRGAVVAFLYWELA